MIDEVTEPTAGVVGVSVSGKLRHEDFVKLRAWVDAAVESRHKCGLLVVFDDFRGWDAQGFWDDIKFHSTQCQGVERIAYVGDKAWERAAVAVSKPITKSAVRYFDASALESARAWLAEATRPSMTAEIEVDGRLVTFTLDEERGRWQCTERQEEADFPFVTFVGGKRYELYSNGKFAEVEKT